VVYGQAKNTLTDAFSQRLRDLKPDIGLQWIALGYFNQIQRARDKNNHNICRSRITKFRDALHACELKEIHLQNRKFIDSDEQQAPTMSRIHGFF
jgi:hypothetical protein